MKKNSKNRSKNERILVVDDSPATLEMIKRNLESRDFVVLTAPGAYEATAILEAQSIDLVITDLKMPKIDGLDLIKHVRQNYKETEIMMITGYATIEGAVEAIKMGAEEYLTKPFTEEELFSAVNKTLDKLHKRRIIKTQPQQHHLVQFGIIGESDIMKRVFTDIEKVASSSANVLITGESGTGKELIARAIHYSSPRASAPFVPINCGGIPESLLESELFGYVKGAFTGATETRAGFFQTAEGGTIFLDEISEMSLAMQVKVLRVLEDKEVCMVGDTKATKLDIRIVAATNKDLRSMVRKGAFREDLFFRVNVINISVPPLSQRGNDIYLLGNHFAEKFAREIEKPVPKFSNEALDVLKNYQWPGNVRELENVVQRLVVMTDGDIIDVPDMPSLMRFSALGTKEFTGTLAQMEKQYIQKVLATVNNNKTKAAQILGIDRKTLREKLKTQHSDNMD
jgi:two-component system response regulator HydG